MKSAGYRTRSIARAAMMVTLAVTAMTVYAPFSANAQDATLPTAEVNITLNQAPVRTALDTLFKSAGLNYTIDPSVTGLVTVSLRAIPFDVALRSILRSSEPPLAFTVEDGVYNIHPRVEQIDITANNPASGTAAVAPTTPAPAPDESTVSQVVPLRLEYANAALILRYALSGPNTGYIPTLNAPLSSGGGQGGQSGGQSGGFGGGQSGGFGGGQSGGFSSGGSSGGFGGGQSGGSSGGFGGGGSTGF